MSNKNRWSYDRYALVLQGHEDIPSLRRTVSGFEPSDGYDLRKFHDWSKSRKARVRDYYARVTDLLAQPRELIRIRNKVLKRRAQEAYHGEHASKSFKVIFLPYDPPIGSDGEILKPKIRAKGDGIVVERGDGGHVEYLFDQYALATEPEAEIERGTDFITANGGTLFYVQCGQFQTLNGSDAGIIQDKVLKWISKYDGVSSITTGRHKGDAAADHYYGDWLKAIKGIRIGEESAIDAQRKIRAGMDEAKKRKSESKRSSEAMVEVMRAMRKIEDRHTRFDFETMLKNSPHDRETLNIFKREIAKVTRRQNKK